MCAIMYQPHPNNNRNYLAICSLWSDWSLIERMTINSSTRSHNIQHTHTFLSWRFGGLLFLFRVFDVTGSDSTSTCLSRSCSITANNELHIPTIGWGILAKQTNCLLPKSIIPLPNLYLLLIMKICEEIITSARQPTFARFRWILAD